MAYFLGAIFPIILSVLGALLLIDGIIEPHTNFATAGAVLLTGLFIAFKLNNKSKNTA